MELSPVPLLRPGSPLSGGRGRGRGSSVGGGRGAADSGKALLTRGSIRRAITSLNAREAVAAASAAAAAAVGVGAQEEGGPGRGSTRPAPPSEADWLKWAAAAAAAGGMASPIRAAGAASAARGAATTSAPPVIPRVMGTVHIMDFCGAADEVRIGSAASRRPPKRHRQSEPSSGEMTPRELSAGETTPWGPSEEVLEWVRTASAEEVNRGQLVVGRSLLNSNVRIFHQEVL